MVLAPDDLLGTARGGMRTMKVETTDRGFFQFGGLESGTYTVTATRDGWSPARVDGITVAENAEAVVRSPLTLQPLARVDLLLDPPLDLDDREWTVRLERMSEWGQRERIAERAASAGRWAAEKLEEGLYLVTVTGTGGSVTGPSGEFEIRVPAQDSYVQVIVAGSGFPVKTATLALSGSEDTREVVLARRGGRVFVPSRDVRSLPTITAPGLPPLSLYLFTDPGMGGLPRNKVSGGYVLELEPAAYTFCADRGTDRCVTRVIAAGAEERIEFPAETVKE